MSSSFEDCFSSINDPRVEGRIDYPLLEIIFLCVSSIVCGMDGWEDIEDFGHSKLDWLKRFFPFENGIPKHDTIARLISRLSPTGLQSSFVEWVQLISELTDGEVIAIDGKRARRSYDKKNNKSAIHMVSAWACSNGIVLGQKKTEDKSNEITAIPKLLEVLEIKGCIITIDAMGCQKDIAKAITEKGADYVLALKGNQSSLNEMVEDLFEKGFETDFKNLKLSKHHELDKGHGRIEQRTCYALFIPQYLESYKDEWVGLNSFICIDSKREINVDIATEKRYYISSVKPNAAKLNKVVRSHWSVENNLHWVLDVSFNEDASRIRRGMASENMTVMRHLAINLLKQDKKNKLYIPRKQRKALFYDDYRERLLKNNGF